LIVYASRKSNTRATYLILTAKMKFLLALLSISSAAAFSPSAFKSTSIASAKATSTQLYGGDGEYGASSTSFYTTTEKQESYASLEDVLNAKCKDDKVKAVIRDMLEACADITEALRTALVTVEGSENTFGDAQLSVDVIADNLMWEACKNSAVIREGASEEDPEVRGTDDQGDGEFTVCWDPLDGSSIVDNNWAVGTIVGVWPKSTGLIGATGRDQVTSLVAIYGPRTTVLVALDDGTYEFSYGCTPEGCQLPDGSWEPWICSRNKIQIGADTKIFSPANLRAAQEVAGYKKLVDHYMTDRYTLRYSGGLVPDIYQQFTKTQGIFTNPTSPKSPAKIRLSFEAAPFALLVEKAGGKTSDGVTGGSILDVVIESVDQRCALAIGSANEVDRFNDWVVEGN
jgi:sedoheptulose-bisphosphatase